MARASFIELRTILTIEKFNLLMRKMFMKSYIWLLVLYGCETWTLETNMLNKLEASEIVQKNAQRRNSKWYVARYW